MLINAENTVGVGPVGSLSYCQYFNEQIRLTTHDIFKSFAVVISQLHFKTLTARLNRETP